jgi:hypothetical protein
MMIFCGPIWYVSVPSSSIFDAQIAFIQKSAIVSPMINILNIPPMSPLWFRMKAEGRLLTDFSMNSTDGTIHYRSRMGNKQLREGFKKIITTIFEPDNYYKRIDALIQYMEPKVRTVTKKLGCGVLLRLVLKILFFSQQRFRNWKLLIRTLLSKPKAMTIAVKSIIVGTHCMVLSEKLVSSISDSMRK